MIIGLNNLFTSFWFLLMIGGGLKLASFILPRFYRIDTWFAKFWLIVLLIILTGVIIFFLIKFRLLIINKKRLISIYPFRLKITIIEKLDIESKKWYNVEQKATLHKCLLIEDSKKNIIKFTDFEFENFYTLESKIMDKKEGNIERDSMIKEQANNNIGYSKFLTLILFGFSIFMLALMIKDSSYFELRITILILSMILFFSSIRKTLRYIKIKKYGVQQLV